MWRKSSRSAEGTSGQCVEIAPLAGLVGVRDSKDPNGPKLLLTRDAFRAVLNDLKR
ncbi:DUF397 domain-containing protein [Actinomadura sp. GC306]|uniref:DUF397 domain-containing protein n=1 Tax=Actinomadura sp. GC306 TaxID=2530367 RepID=UPI001047C544|nr:DUF397 domain-containing protein [Actinomadura sp. GC306]TDC69150.1 DUF397 domain-containing protein [Actinomadura sp. GC306]